MKVIQFTVPVSNEWSVVVQEDILPKFYQYLHRHEELQLTYILKGEGTLIVGNYTQPFKEDDIYIIGANEPHMFKGGYTEQEYADGKSIHAVHVFFDQHRLANFLETPELQEIKKYINSLQGSIQLSEKYAPFIKPEIIKLKDQSGLAKLLSFTSLFDYLAKEVKISKSLTTGISLKKYSESEGIRMNDIFQYTIENFHKEISLEKISAIAHMTPHSFCKYFKKHTRKTYLSFLNEIRINEACKLLLAGTAESISAIAYKTGFNNVINFNRVFKKITEVSPTDYIKMYKFKNKL
ncbi:helix-turn-helix domain-containing protein [Sphingobacteriaceae bacterium WQ 2009]|uniref:Helix-turn-helix domain-containing protein n=1 Tax=Rhinopithecimicrobium faecis TaxID=2820698 RepID=A0A8T4H5P1_9SPHI|nr:helix-turn-helix domain-containing protein [Sphingobacteriaceae bacterium WQ 2009]